MTIMNKSWAAVAFTSFLIASTAAPSTQTSSSKPAPRTSYTGRCADLFKSISPPALSVEQINKGQSSYRLVTVGTTSAGSGEAYRVDTGGGHTLDSSVMSDILQFIAAARGDRIIYLDVTSLRQRKREAFQTTLEVARTATDNALPIRFVHDLDAFHNPDAKRESLAVVDQGTFRNGERAGSTYAFLDAKVDSTKYGVNVWSRTAVAVKRFVERFTAFFKGTGNKESVLHGVVRIRREIAAEQHIPEADLVVQIRQEMGASQFVDLRRAPDFAAE